MMKRIYLFSMLIILSGAAQAAEKYAVPLSTSIARPLLEQDPAVAAARAGLEVALQQAGILDSSPYEWTARYTQQRRTPHDETAMREWEGGIERTLRLPGKASSDRNIGKATIAESQARYGEALRDTANELLTLWVESLIAERANELATANLRSAEESLAAVEKRLRAGDASTLDVNLVRAELGEQKRLQSETKTQALIAQSRLSTRFSGLNPLVVSLPAPLPIVEEMSYWRERILMQSDKLKIVQAQLQRAQATAARMRADKIPDPTIGFFRASEAGGRERINGISISIPFPGGARFASSAKAIAEAEVSHQELELMKRKIETEIAIAVAMAKGNYDSAQIANESATAMQENAKLTQRAYTLGETELQNLLLARRQAATASIEALRAQETALKAYYKLLLDAHLIWDLEHD